MLFIENKPRQQTSFSFSCLKNWNNLQHSHIFAGKVFDWMSLLLLLLSILKTFIYCINRTPSGCKLHKHIKIAKFFPLISRKASHKNKMSTSFIWLLHPFDGTILLFPVLWQNRQKSKNAWHPMHVRTDLTYKKHGTRINCQRIGNQQTFHINELRTLSILTFWRYVGHCVNNVRRPFSIYHFYLCSWCEINALLFRMEAIPMDLLVETLFQ